MAPGFLQHKGISRGKFNPARVPFPAMQLPELNGSDGRNVFGWGDEDQRLKEQRRQIEASWRVVVAARCANCGTITPQD